MKSTPNISGAETFETPRGSIVLQLRLCKCCRGLQLDGLPPRVSTANSVVAKDTSSPIENRRCAPSPGDVFADSNIMRSDHALRRHLPQRRDSGDHVSQRSVSCPSVVTVTDQHCKAERRRDAS